MQSEGGGPLEALLCIGVDRNKRYAVGVGGVAEACLSDRGGLSLNVPIVCGGAAMEASNLVGDASAHCKAA